MTTNAITWAFVWKHDIFTRENDMWYYTMKGDQCVLFQIYHFEQTTAEMSDQLNTIQTNYNHLQEEVRYSEKWKLWPASRRLKGTRTRTNEIDARKRVGRAIEEGRQTEKVFFSRLMVGFCILAHRLSSRATFSLRPFPLQIFGHAGYNNFCKLKVWRLMRRWITLTPVLFSV